MPISTASEVGTRNVVALLKACAKTKEIEKGIRIHGEIVKSGLLEANLSVGNSLVNMYAKFGMLDKAKDVFQQLPILDTVSWNVLISGYAQHDNGNDVLNCFERMKLCGFSPSVIASVCLLKACGSINGIAKGQEVHSLVLINGLIEGNQIIGNGIVDMYAKCCMLQEAQKVFDELGDQDVISWNTLIVGYSQQSQFKEALECFHWMQLRGFTPDAVTYSSILKVCGSIGAIQNGEKVHAQIVGERLLEKDIIVGNALIDMYARSGMLDKAEETFDELPIRNAVSWNALLAGYTENSPSQRAFKNFQRMQLEGILPTDVTFVCISRICGIMESAFQGQQVHTQIVNKRLFQGNIVVGNALINMYAKCALLGEAEKVLGNLLAPNVISWNALIAGYAQHGYNDKALECVHRMQMSGVSCDTTTFISMLKACNNSGTLNSAQELHLQITKKGFLENSTTLGNVLIDAYANCCAFAEAENVFQQLPFQDLISWNILISRYVQNGYSAEAIKYFNKMQQGGFPPNAVTFVCSLKALGSLDALAKGEEIHSEIVRAGLLDNDVVIGNALLDMYFKCCAVAKLKEVFERLPIQDVVSWNVLIAGLAQHGNGEGLKYFEQMQMMGICPNAVTFFTYLKVCGCTGAIEKGMEIHSKIISDESLVNNFTIKSVLIDMYGKFNMLRSAQEIFDDLQVRDIVSWTALIAGYAEHMYDEQAIDLFDQMQLDGILPDEVTYCCVLKICGNMGAPQKGQVIHADIIKVGPFEEDTVVINALIYMYAKCGMLAEAQETFDRTSVQDLVSWNALIGGYTQYGNCEAALNCFRDMQLSGFSPDAATYPIVLKACGSMGAFDKGQEIHFQIKDDEGLMMVSAIASSLIDMYAKYGAISKAKEVFDELPAQNVASWNALISAYAQNGCEKEVMKCFDEMQTRGLYPDASSFLLILKMCANMSAPSLGQEIHAKIQREGFLERNHVFGSALITMYVRCGMLEKAQEVFDELPVQDLVSWTALIMGYAQHGYGEEALNSYTCMQHKGIPIDKAAFTCILKACGGMGYVVKGQQIHDDVVKTGLLDNSDDSGNTLVDMYAKCGMLEEAEYVFSKLSVYNIVSWNVLMSAYAQVGKCDFVVYYLKKMLEHGEEPNPATFTILLNACSHTGLLDRGEMCLEMMIQSDIIPSLEHFNCVVNLLGRTGCLDRAMVVITEMPFLPDARIWRTAMDACQRCQGVERAKTAFEHAMQLDQNATASYICMSNIYSDVSREDGNSELIKT